MNIPIDGKRGSGPVVAGPFDASAVASTVVSRSPTIQPARLSDSSSRDAPVDIRRAKEEFAALDRSITKLSRNENLDLEKASEDDFDLRDYFTSSNAANVAQGIRHKHVGVTWSDLRVEVPDIGSKVRTSFADKHRTDHQVFH